MGESSKAKDLIEKIKVFLKKEKPHIKLFDERIKRLFQIAGWGIFIGCVIYWIFYMFIAQDFTAVLATTYFTVVLISLTCIFKLESVFLNTITCLTFYGFLNITIAFIPQVDDFFTLMVAPVLHGIIAGFQLFLIFHPKVPISKKYLLWGVLFFSIFMVAYDDYGRFSYITGLSELIPFAAEFMKAYAFYALIFSAIGIYIYKRLFGILVN
ncbi:MAG: hypothetical protein ACFFFB_08565 [Candidatus Heimdallarchaeota archaeon]